MYPEHTETDFIEEFCEDQIFEDHLVSFCVIALCQVSFYMIACLMTDIYINPRPECPICFSWSIC